MRAATGVPSDRRTARLRKESRRLVVAFFLGWVIVYTSRAILSPVLSTIGEEFRVTPAQLGLLGSAFYLAYAALQIPVGLAAERLGRKRLLVVGFVAFGLTTALSGLAPSYWVLFMLVALTGLGQATYYPTQYSIAAESVPTEGRAFHMALINSGMAVGVAGGASVASWMSFGLGLGWRAPMILTGALTLATAVLLARMVREPEREPHHQPALPERARLFRRHQAAAHIAGFCSLYGFFTILTWLPYYLERFRGFGGLSAGLLLSIAAWISIPAAIGLSMVSDRYRVRRRPLLVLFPLGAVAMVLLMTAAGTAQIVLALILYGICGKLSTDPLLIAYMADTSTPRNYSTTFGVFNFAGMMGSVGAPITTGAIVQATGRMDWAFMVAAGLLVVASVVLAVWGKRDRPRKERRRSWES